MAGDRRHHQVTGRDVLHLPGEICRQRGVVVFVAFNLHLFRGDAGQHHIFHRATGHADGFAAQRRHIFHLRPFRAKHAEEERRVGAAEINHLLTLGVFPEAGDNQIHFISLQIRHPVGAGHRHPLQLELHLFCQITRHIDVIALRLQIGPHRTERREILRNRNADHPALFNILQLVGFRRGDVGEQTSGPGQGDQQFFHGVYPLR